MRNFTWMKYTVLLLLAFCSQLSFAQVSMKNTSEQVAAYGSMPNIKEDNAGILHLVYGNSDSIFYKFSTDRGQSFSLPELVSAVPGLFSFAMRGPQLAVSDKGLVITATTKQGDILCLVKNNKSEWSQPFSINDVNGSAPEGLMALDADGANVFAVWLDTRNRKKGQAVYGAHSVDGGATWSKNLLVYASPDQTVCECCKPSVLVKGNNVYAMFRNYVNGNRDLYLVSSVDRGKTFGKAQKLGKDSWKLNGCPMDGGALTINDKGKIQTVWRREGAIYAAEPGKPEKQIGEGKICTMTSVNNTNVYSWIENGEVVVLLPDGKKISTGKGTMPVLEPIDKHTVACVWENEKQIHFALLNL
jgi:hypothetical protein